MRRRDSLKLRLEVAAEMEGSSRRDADEGRAKVELWVAATVGEITEEMTWDMGAARGATTGPVVPKEGPCRIDGFVGGDRSRTKGWRCRAGLSLATLRSSSRRAQLRDGDVVRRLG